MSLFKEDPRPPKCARCRHHGVLVPKKGHTRSCPFLRCDCWKCSLSTQRTRITALQRGLMRGGQRREQRPRRETTGAGGAKGSSSSATPERGAPPAATSGAVSPPSGGLADGGAQEAGGEQVVGSDSRELPPFASSEKRPSFSPSYFGEFGQAAAPLPFIHFPFRMPGYYPGSYSAPPDLLFNMPWLPPLPAGLYGDGLCGPLMFPHYPPGGVHQTPPPEPGALADGMPLFIRLHPVPVPETFPEESRQHPQPPPPKSTDAKEEDIKEE